MKEAIKIFENAQFGQVRTSVTDSGEPLFCLTDVCEALGLKNPSDVKSRLGRWGVVTTEVSTPIISQGRDTGKTKTQQLNFITEPNLYKCIFQSRKKEAEQFQDWVCSEVLPAIRKTGGYIASRENETEEELMARALTIAHATLERYKKAVKDMQPGATFAKAVETAKNSILIGELARLLKQNGVDTGTKRLFRWLRHNGYLCKQEGELFNLPTQKAMDLGLFELKKMVVQNSDGETLVTTTTKVTGKGQVYFLHKFIPTISISL